MGGRLATSLLFPIAWWFSSSLCVYRVVFQHPTRISGGKMGESSAQFSPLPGDCCWCDVLVSTFVWVVVTGTWLVFFHIVGMIILNIPIDFHIFQRNWNHQPVLVQLIFCWLCLLNVFKLHGSRSHFRFVAWSHAWFCSMMWDHVWSSQPPRSSYSNFA